MAYKLIETRDFETFIINKFMIDNLNDLQSILVDYFDYLHEGWIAKLPINTSGEYTENIYSLDRNNCWMKSDGESIDYIKSWKQLQEVVRQGNISKYYNIGDQIDICVGGIPRKFDIIGIDEDCPVDTPTNHVLTLQMHYLLEEGMKSSIVYNPQFLYSVSDNSLTSGTYRIYSYYGDQAGDEEEDGDYYFEIPNGIEVPVGGGIRHTLLGGISNSYSRERVKKGKFILYDNDKKTILAECPTLLESSNPSTYLGKTTCQYPNKMPEEGEEGYSSNMNFLLRAQQGGNIWKTSFVRYYLNLDEEDVISNPYTKWGKYNLYTSVPINGGFLYNIDPQVKEVMCKVRKKYAKDITYSTYNSSSNRYIYNYDVLEDYVTLPTLADLGYGNNLSNIFEGPCDANGENIIRDTAYSFWKGKKDDANNMKKYYKSEIDDPETIATAHVWCLSSPTISQIRCINKGGNQSSGGGSSAFGISPIIYIG